MCSKIYACYLMSKEEVEKSSSGGAFSALTQVILDNSGVVIGCQYNYKYHYLEFVKAEQLEQRNQMRGSKYIQADPMKMYALLSEELSKRDNTTPVFVIGTPCQIAGARAYMEAKHSTTHREVFFCDLLCHGVSSPEMWREYVRNIEETNNSKVSSLTFKDKSQGWIRPTAKVTLQNGKEVLVEDYARLYRSDDFMRDSCYHCKFSTQNRVSDITIGDFWSIGVSDPQFANLRGTSFLMLNTMNGEKLFEKAKAYLFFKEKKLSEGLQPNLQAPTKKTKCYASIHADYKKHGLNYIIDKYIHYGPGNALARRIRRKVQRIKYEGDHL